ncbi:MAG: hypothetical protein ACXVRM_09050 [Solirubrobacteraceae bacterium]
MTQAVRTVQTAGATLDGAGDLEAAGDDLRSYGTMLLIAAPLLIDGALSRTFLEEAQSLAGELVRALHAHRQGTAGEAERARLKRRRRAHASRVASTAGHSQSRAARGRHRRSHHVAHRDAEA